MLSDEELSQAAQKRLDHFGISSKDIPPNGYWEVRNIPKIVEAYALERYGLDKHKKFRAIIDYDSEFEVFIVRTEVKD